MLIKKRIILILLFFLLLGFVSTTLKVSAQITEVSDSQQLELSEKINVYFFWSSSCPHCADEKEFLKKLAQERSDVKINSFEVTKNAQNGQLLQMIGKVFNFDVSAVPITLVANTYFTGWQSEETSGQLIIDGIECIKAGECADILTEFLKNSGKKPVNDKRPATTTDSLGGMKEIPDELNLPLIGTIKTKNFSLPVLTIIIAALDGFNPCAMWVLVFLISLLLSMQNKKRMWLLGTAFIFTSSLVYFLFLAAWLNIFLFLGFVLWIRIIIGLVALFSGFYNLKEYHYNKQGICKITNAPQRQKIFDKIKRIIERKSFWLALVGIMLLAVAVNMVELLCSAGLPAIYTQILTLSELPTWQYYIYLVLYVLIFMLDDLVVFFIAMTSLKAANLSGKYSQWSHLVGGILMLIIGVLMIFKPEFLSFG